MPRCWASRAARITSKPCSPRCGPKGMRPIVAIATGDPAGIGPEISLKAALDKDVRALCRPLLVGDPDVVAGQAKSCGIAADIRVIEDLHAIDGGSAIPLLAVPAPDAARIEFGKN